MDSPPIEPSRSSQRRGVPCKIFHVDGAGSRPDGTGSGFCWIRLDKPARRTTWVAGLTGNQAEYRALLEVLKYLAPGSRAIVFTDSQLVAYQFSGRFRAKCKHLKLLLRRARALIIKKNLQVDVKWIPRAENLAGRLLERRRHSIIITSNHCT